MNDTVKFDERPFLLLCEGESDKRFFDHLITSRAKIEKSFQVKFPSRDNDKSGGNSKFGTWLNTAFKVPAFKKNVKAVLVVSDNDSNGMASFEALQRVLTAAQGFPIPRADRTVAKAEGFPSIVIFMLPHGELGSLETLCLGPAYGKWPIEASLNQFFDSSPAKDWNPSKQAKMRLQCMIAANCKQRPEAGFSGLWWQDEEYHLPLGDPAFDDISEFLAGFRALVDAA